MMRTYENKNKITKASERHVGAYKTRAQNVNNVSKCWRKLRKPFAESFNKPEIAESKL